MITYYTDKNALDPKWVDDYARKAASSFFDSDPKKTIKSSQLRKFYADVKSLERQWQASGGDEDAFAVILPMIKLLKAKSSYACKRNVVPENFRAWIEKHVDSVNAARDFKAFLLHFEAVVGFSYGFAHGNFA